MIERKTPNKRPSEDTGKQSVQKKRRHTPNSSLALHSDPITLLVAGTNEKLYIHKDLLSSDSWLFYNALKRDRKNKQDRTVQLPEVNQDAFRIYTTWLYSGKVYTNKTWDYSAADEHLWISEIERLLNCYRLGDFLQSLDFQDAAIDAIADTGLWCDKLLFTIIRCVYQVSGKESLHRKLCRDLFLHLKGLTVERIREVGLPREFLEDIWAGTYSHVRGKISKAQNRYKFGRIVDGYKYHEHTRLNTPCYKAKFYH